MRRLFAVLQDEVRLVFGPEWVGRIVELRYEDGAWYQAKIRRFLKDGSHEVEFLQDGSIENVILAKVRPQPCTAPISTGCLAGAHVRLRPAHQQTPCTVS